MHDGYYAVYIGKEYSSNRIDDKLVLRSESLEDLKKGFEECEPFIFYDNKMVVCMKYVTPLEVEDFYEITTKVLCEGYEFGIGEKTDDEIEIVAMTGNYLDWLDMGMECIDKGVYAKWIKKSEAEFKVIKETPDWFCKMRQNAEDKERQKRWHLKESAARCGEYVFYKGKEYPAVRTDNKLILHSDSFNDLENGFKPCRPFTCGTPVRQKVVCVKFIDPSEAEETYIIRLHAVYKGMVFNVIDGVEGSNHINLETPYCLLHNPMGEQLEIKNALTERGFCEGRYEGFGSRYEKDISVDDSALEIVEERIETDDKFIPVKKESKVIKCGKYAVYKGREYPVRQNEDSSLMLLSGNIEDIDKGFELCKPFIRDFTEEEVICIKHADPSEVEKTYEIRPHAVYKGMFFIIAKRDIYKPDMVTLSTSYVIAFNPSGIQLEIKKVLAERGFTDGECKFIKDQNSYSCWYEKRVSISEPELKMIGGKVQTDNKFIPVERKEASAKYGEYVVYMGKEYISSRKYDDRLVLFSGSTDALKKGFKICKPFICRYTGEEITYIKYVDPLEAEDYYELTTKIIYDGNEYYAGEETDTEIEIVCVEEGESHIRHDMEMECIADGIYTKWIKKSEAEINIVRKDILWFRELKQREKDKSMADLAKEE